MKHRGVARVAMVAVTMATPAVASGQEEPPAFGVETYEPGSPESNVLGVETSGVPGHLEPTADVVIQRVERPLNLRLNDETEPLVDDRWSLDMGLGIGLSDRLLLDARLAMVTFQSGTALGSLPAFGTGDMRLRAKWRLVERGLDQPFGLAVQAALWAPTGGEGLVGEGTPRAEPRVDFDVKVGPALAVLNLGYQVRGTREFAGYRHDDVVRWGAGVRVPLPSSFRIDGSIYGSHSPFVLSDEEPNAFAHPIEALGGVGWERHGLNLSLAAGAGLTRGVGAPAHRISLSVGYAPRPDEVGRAVELDTVSYFECPDGTTRDAPAECPPLDRDGDEIADVDDACPDEPGIRDKRGCPFVDRDGDGVDDTVDACPDEPGDPRDGCPSRSMAATEPEEIEERLDESIFFGNDSAKFEPKEHPLIYELSQLVDEDDSVVRIVVEGHTDSRGPSDYNLELSRQRAETVRQVLTDTGIEPGRIEAIGRGESDPIADNETVAGQARNRRVAFRVIRRVEPETEPPVRRATPPADPPETPVRVRDVPVGVREEETTPRIEVDPPPEPQIRRLEVSVGSGFLVAREPFGLSTPGEIATLSSARFTARLLALENFSVGLVGDVGSLTGTDRPLFTPGIGFEAVVHAPLGAFRPFVSAGAEAWFPGLRSARPGVDAALGLDWEPVSGAGVRGSARTVVIANDGSASLLPGGFLGVYTSF